MTTTSKNTIETHDDVQRGLIWLAENDTALAAIIPQAGDIPLRRIPGGFEGLARIIIAQQVSKASADAITARTEEVLGSFCPHRYLVSSDEERRHMGLSRPKQRTLESLCRAIADGSLKLDSLDRIAPAKAIDEMVAIKGIGPWTAEVYLMFCAGHPDIFPAGDLALQIVAHEALGLRERPTDKQLRVHAESWAPWRSVAARLLWAWYGQSRKRTIIP